MAVFVIKGHARGYFCK